MTTIADIAQSIGVIFACWAVIAGINAWRREFVGKRRIEIAEEVLEAFFTLRDAVAFIRHPCSNPEEGKSRKPGVSETEAETKLMNRAYIVWERYQVKKDVFSRFETLKYRVMAAFGKDAERIFTRTERVLGRIFASANTLGTRYWPRLSGGQMKKKDWEEKDKHEAILWDNGLPDDEIKRDLNAILSDLENVTASAFKSESSLYGWLKKKLFKSR